MSKLLIVDTETSGLDPLTHSILSLGAVVWQDGMIGECFEVLINEPEIVVDARSMEINGIDLVAHAVAGVSPVVAMDRFRAFLSRNFDDLLPGDKIPLAGHNVGFDIGFLRRLCRLSGQSFDQIFSHRVLDTAGIVRFLNLADLLHLTGAGLTEAFEFFKIPIADDERHGALADARATAALLTKLIELVRRGPLDRRG